MQYLPKHSVELLRPNGNWNAKFPHPYEATEEQLRSTLYITESWTDPATGKYYRWTDSKYVVVSFDEIKATYDHWDQSEYDESERYHSVYDWLRDAFMDKGGVFQPCRLTAGTRISCMDYYGTGGGCVQMIFKFNDEVWIATDFDLIESFDAPYDEVAEDDIDGHRKYASIPLPTWQEVLDYAKENLPNSYNEIQGHTLHLLNYLKGTVNDRLIIEEDP